MFPNKQSADQILSSVFVGVKRELQKQLNRVEKQASETIMLREELQNVAAQHMPRPSETGTFSSLSGSGCRVTQNPVTQSSTKDSRPRR